MAHIMIIDDDIELADNTAALIRQQGHAVTVAYTTEAAESKLSEMKPDLLILDVMFPDNPAGGFDLARRIRHTQAFDQLPIVLLTGVNQQFPMDFSDGDIDPDWMPVQAFMEKPVNPDLLFEVVEKMLKA